MSRRSRRLGGRGGGGDAKIPGVAVTSVLPTTQFNLLAGQDITVRGANFQVGATVSMVHPTAGTVACTNVVVHNSVKIFCKVPALPAEGKVDIVVTNPDTKMATLPLCYRGFNSTSIGLWLDPSFSGNDTTTVPGRYKTIVDRSGNSRDVTQTVDAQCPNVDQIGGIPAAKFQINYHMRGPGFTTPAAAEGFLVVKKPLDSGSSNCLWRTGTAVGVGFHPTTDRRILDEFGSTTRKDTNGSPPPPFAFNSAYVYSITSKAASWTVRFNNTQHYTTAVNVVGFFPTSFVIGGGADANAGAPIDYAFVGNVGEVVVFMRECAAEERTWIQAHFQGKYFGPWPHTLVVCDGDSITSGSLIVGTGLTYPQSLQNLLGGGYVVVNQGLDGDTMANMVTQGASQIDTILATYPTVTNTIVIPWAGTNDLVATALDANGIYAKYQQYVIDRKAAGWKKVIPVTMLPRSGIMHGTPQPYFDAQRAIINSLLQGGNHAGGDALADPASNATMGPTGAETNTTYYVDLVHPTNLGASINAGIIYNAILATIPDV